MQSKIDIVRAYYNAIDAGNLEMAGQFLSDDFQRFGTTPESMGKQDALKTLSLLKAAFPALKHALSNIRFENGVVMLTAQAGGRHTGQLDLSDIGMGIIPGSGRMVIFPPDHYEFTVADEKIITERNVTTVTEHTGVAGFLKAVGVPAM